MWPRPGGSSRRTTSTLPLHYRYITVTLPLHYRYRRQLSPHYVDVASPRPLTISLLGGNFAPTDGLQCGFGVVGGQQPVAASFVASGVVRCDAPRSSLSNLVVHARHDATTWSAEGLTLIVYNSSRPSLIRRVFPDAVALGLAANLSIVGAATATRLLRYYAVRLHASITLLLRAAISSVTYGYSLCRPRPLLRYYDVRSQPLSHAVTPSAKQCHLSIVGANFFPAARPKCRFSGDTAAAVTICGIWPVTICDIWPVTACDMACHHM